MDRKGEFKALESEAILRSTIESINDALLIVGINGCITHYNQSFVKLFSIPKDLLVKNNDEVLLTYAKEQILDPEGFVKKVNEIYQKNVSSRSFVCFKDGRIIDRQFYPLIEDSPIKGGVWIFRDITEQKSKEEILNKFKVSIDHSFDGVFWINSEAGFDYVNEQACKMLGYTYEELIKLKIWDIDINASQEFFQREWERLHIKKAFDTKSIESTHKRKDGSLYSVKMNSVFVWEEDKSLLIAYAKDITERKKYEEALLKNQTLLLESQRIAKIGSWEHYMEKDEMIWNEQTCAIFGHQNRNNKITFQTFIDYIHSEDRSILENHYSELLQSHNFNDLEVRIIVQPGNIVKHIKIIGEVEFFENNKPYRSFGTVQDITDKEKVIKALKESEQKLESIFNVIPIGIGLTKNRILYDLNPMITTITGYSKEELIGSPPQKIYETEYECNRVGGDLYNNLKKKSTASIETIWQRKDGKHVNVLLAVTLLDPLDESKGFVFAATDITEQKKVEEELLRNQTLLLESQRIAKIGTWELDLKTKKLFWNKEAYQVYGYDDLSIEPTFEVFQKMVHPDDRDFMEKHLETIIKEKKYTDIDCRIITPDGTLKYIIVAGEIIFDDNNEPTGVFGIIQDITERKLIEEQRKKMNMLLEKKVEERTIQLKQAIKDLEAFTYSVSHDLRAPIRHIDGFIHLLSNAIASADEKTQNYIDKISQSSKNMSTLINELLKFSRLGRTDLKYTQINVFLLIEEIVERLKPDYEGRNIIWDIREIPEIYGDMNLLKFAFENLISNAIKYTAKKDIAMIEIGEKKVSENEKVCIYVKDNGVGFDIANKDKLFSVFQRLHSDEDFKGVGIGLSNVKQIIEKHNGKIDAKGEKNKGAIFYVTLPRKVKH